MLLTHRAYACRRHEFTPEGILATLRLGRADLTTPQPKVSAFPAALARPDQPTRDAALTPYLPAPPPGAVTDPPSSGRRPRFWSLAPLSLVDPFFITFSGLCGIRRHPAIADAPTSGR
jgi:hypothetical protein